MVTVGWLLASAAVKMAGDKLGSVIAGQASLVWNIRKDMEDMKDTLETMTAVLQDAKKRSVKEAEVQLWLKRLKNAAYDIADMLDEFNESSTQSSQQMKRNLPIDIRKIFQANKMKSMREKLRKIEAQHTSFKFTSSTIAIIDRQQQYDERETTSGVNESDIIGRDAEKRALMDILISANKEEDETVIVPVYGLGGIGKTTLAAMIYNDTQFKTYDHRAWVYVSQVFDLRKIGASMISQIQEEVRQQNTDTMQLINQCLDDLLPGKKVLIVLDDIWEEREFELEKLKRMLRVGKKGSDIDVIVTTRKESIANKICTNEPYMLQPMKDDRCWDIIKKFSQVEDKANKEQFLQIGLEIAKKCGGVALAAQALGYMLKSKDMHGWSEINNSEIWNVSFEDEDEDDSLPHKTVLPSLKLSYERMPPHLRLCFSYCAIFPKGHEFLEVDLIHQWSAMNFVKLSKGKEYAKLLLGMSFLQYSKVPRISGKHVVPYTMHDLVHDLARSVIGDELFVFDGTAKSIRKEKTYCRYALLTNYDRPEKLSSILPKKVRALHFQHNSKFDIPGCAFSFAKCLRILDFSKCSNILLPSIIGQLKQLKYLISPRLQNERLPECITELLKLEYLNLHGSSKISELPETIGRVGCLIFLGLSGCSGISKLPESFGDLKCMVHLDMSGCSGMRELPGSFGNLTNLQHLDLSECHMIKAIPEDIGSLMDLQYFNISRCWRIRELPESFTKLRNLLHLDLVNCHIEKGISRALRGLTSLQHLDMSNNFRATLNDDDLPDAMRSLTNLKYLNLSNCMAELFGNSIKRSDKHVDFVGELTNLENLNLSCNSALVYLPESIANLKKLHKLNLIFCKELKSLPDSIRTMRLKSLLMEGCSNELIDHANSQLHYSLTLPVFKVRASDLSACSNLFQLEGVNVGELKILALENVRLLEEARKVKLSDKQNLSDLTLSWTSNIDRLLEDEDLLEQLVPPRGLKCLHLKGYKSTSFPSWFMGISHHLPNLVTISFDNMPTCCNLPPLGLLPNLERLCLIKLPSISKIDRDLFGGNGAFRRLSRISIEAMEGLEEWNTTYSGEDGVDVFMFPCLDELWIYNCPRLRLKPYPPTFREFIIKASDQVLSWLEGASVCHLTSTPSTNLVIIESKCKSLRLFHHFHNLKELELVRCSNLTSLPDSMRHLVSLQSLFLAWCESISALPEWLPDLTSLRSLRILGCASIRCLPSCIQQLTKLQMLHIGYNQELKLWSELEENMMKLAHINNIVTY